jgi:hypothetical protein
LLKLPQASSLSSSLITPQKSSLLLRTPDKSSLLLKTTPHDSDGNIIT